MGQYVIRDRGSEDRIVEADRLIVDTDAKIFYLMNEGSTDPVGIICMGPGVSIVTQAGFVDTHKI